MSQNTQQNKMLTAYQHLIEDAKETILNVEIKSWDLLGKAVHSAEEQHENLLELTQEQLQQVKQDVHQDLMNVAEHLSEVKLGIEDFITMDVAYLEEILLEKCNQLADPTELTVLRMRMLAAMEK